MQDLLLFIEISSCPPDSDGTETATTPFKIPTLETILEVYHQNEQQHMLYAESHINLQGVSHIPIITLRLMIILLSQKPNQTRQFSDRIPPDPAWFIETLVRLFTILRIDDMRTSMGYLASHRLTLFLEILTSLLPRVLNGRSGNLVAPQLSMLLVQSLRTITSLSFRDMSRPLQDVIYRLLSSLSSVCTESLAYSEAIHMYLKPAVQDFVEKADFSETFGENIRVCEFNSSQTFVLSLFVATNDACHKTY